MDLLSPADAAEPGLRERKKARTRSTIQEHALRLFRQRGYDETTVEQIAAAAEVSPSTFFRYFPTKEDVVLYDDLDPILFEAYAAQPSDLGAVGAMRRALKELVGLVSPADLAKQSERAELIFSVPELRMRMLDELVRTLQVFGGLLASRAGRSAADPKLQALAGAMLGIIVATWFNNGSALSASFLAEVDTALGDLEAGFKL